MAQQRLRNYKNKLPSFEHNLFNLGMHNPGRYVGFDTIAAIGVEPTLSFEVRHTATGVSYQDTNNAAKGPFGMLLSPQGTLIKEDAPLGPFTIDSNLGNSSKRYDLLYCEHNQVQLTGGQAATYSIIKGPVGSTVKPILPNPKKQIAIGTIEIKANGVTFADIVWHKAKCPDSGDGEDARLADVNIFQAFQGQKQSYFKNTISFLIDVNSGVSARLFKFFNDGNVFRVLPDDGPSGFTTTLDGILIEDVPLQNGMEITIFINHKVTLRETGFFLPTYHPLGYRRFSINQGLGNVTANGGMGALGVKPPNGEVWGLKFILYEDTWFLMSISGAGTSSKFTRGMCIEWYGDIAANFDDGGLGKNLMLGWQICNSNNQTPDTRGRIRFMGTDVPAAGTAALDPFDISRYNMLNDQAGGYSEFTIFQMNLPSLPSGDAFPGEYGLVRRSVSGEVKTATSFDATGAGVEPDIKTPPKLPGIGGSDVPITFVPPCYTMVHVMKL